MNLQSGEAQVGTAGIDFGSLPVHKSVCAWGLSADSSKGSAPHYEVFVELRGLRNLSEENRDKVNGTGTGYDRMSPLLCLSPGAGGTGEGWGGRGREENLPGALGREG